jgi:hypothetical protein
MATQRKEDALKVIADFLEKSPYTTPAGEVLSGREGALKFVSLFFPDEVDNFEDD